MDIAFKLPTTVMGMRFCLVFFFCLSTEQDDLDAAEVEDARLTYIAAVAAAKEKQDEDSIALAAQARHLLKSLVFRESIH